MRLGLDAKGRREGIREGDGRIESFARAMNPDHEDAANREVEDPIARLECRLESEVASWAIEERCLPARSW